MIGPKILNQKYIDWNKKWGSPYGYDSYNWPKSFIFQILLKLSKYGIISKDNTTLLRYMGIFKYQPNSSTRIFEYPWAFYSTELKPGLTVVDIGGGLSGFQFVLSKYGLNVINVDPGDPEYSWNYKIGQINNINKTFNTTVKLIQKTLDKANIKDESIDRIYSISMLEHLKPNERKIIIKEAYRILKKDGFFIITLDLFLDIYPFSTKKTNKWGSNMDVAKYLEKSGFKIIKGNKSELFGFNEFNTDKVMSNLNNYFMGSTYPVLTQVFVLQKES